MIDVRPVGYLIGWLVAALGASMAVPMLADLVDRQPQRPCLRHHRHPHRRRRRADGARLLPPRRQAARPPAELPARHRHLGRLPASSARCPSGSARRARASPTRCSRRCRRSPPPARRSSSASSTCRAGTLLWRGMLQWFGGLGIVVVAMIFLPALKVGGMQLFRSEAFDTLGKILPARRRHRAPADLDLPDPLVPLLPRLRHAGHGALRRGGARDDHRLDRRHGQQRRLLRRLRRRWRTMSPSSS